VTSLFIPDGARLVYSAALGSAAFANPSVTLGIKRQPVQFNFPANARPSQRATFTDRTLQFSMRNEMTRGWFGAQSSFDFAGSTFQAEALRFGTLGNKAPQVRAPDSDRLPNCSISLEASWHILRPILIKRRSGP
jgi:hypothetical protein